jgi:hypothetical protein
MNGTSPKAAPSTLGRISLWLGSLLLVVCLFSLFISRGASVESVVFIFKVTMIFALPAWFLYLPLVVLLKDAEEQRGWVLLATGILIGPASMALWGLIFQLRGEDAHLVWQGDGEAPGIVANMICASIVGFLTSGLYVASLKLIGRRTL